MMEAIRTVTFTEEEYKIMVRALWELREEYKKNDIIKDDINDILEKVMTTPKRNKIFKSIEER